jgi:hypothetical protein
VVSLQDVLNVLEQKSPIDIRVRMAKVLLKEMIKQEKQHAVTKET